MSEPEPRRALTSDEGEHGEEQLSFADDERVAVVATYIGERIDTRQLEATRPLALSPLTIPAGSSGAAVLFRYGAVVLFHVEGVEQARFFENLSHYVVDEIAADDRESEQAVLRLSDAAERAHQGVIRLAAFDVERIQIVADVLAKSVVLAHYEQHVAEVFGRVEPLAAELSERGGSRRSTRELLRQIGNTLLIETKAVGRVEVTDKPEILWERPDLELLYARLVDEYELVERYQALERKLAVIERTATTALQLLQHHSTLRVEWYIVVLIVAEILLQLVDMLLLR